MYEKNIKKLAIITFVSLILNTALTCSPAKASTGFVTRVSGDNRYATAAKVATTNWTNSYNVILVSGEEYADALVGSALTGKYTAPLVLVDKEGSRTTSQAIDYIRNIASKNTYVQIVGGTEVVTNYTFDTIENMITMIYHVYIPK